MNISEIHSRIKPFIHKTPVLTSSHLNNLLDLDLYFKCENFQKMGAFKIRGALNAVQNLSSRQKLKGVVTHSSGNFAQALSLAAQLNGTKAYIVMPNNAPSVKIDAVSGYGGEIILCEPNLVARENTAARIQSEKGAIFIHPSNNLDVINGQGTAALELLNSVPGLDAIISPVGGGGLIAGSILARDQSFPNVKLYGAEPKNADDAYRSLVSKKIESNKTTNTIADGLKTQLGDLNFPIILKGCESIILVSENEIISALQLIYTRLKIVVEPSSAVSLAAAINQGTKLKGKKVGLIMSGGNISLPQLTKYFSGSIG